MQISGILVLFALSAIVEAQWVAAARNLYQPVILSVGAAFAFMNDKANTDGFSVSSWMADKFSFSETKVEPERRPTDAMQDTKYKGKRISNEEYSKQEWKKHEEEIHEQF